MSAGTDNILDVITVREIAEILHICYPNALKLVKFSKLRHFKIGNGYRVLRKDFTDWLLNTKQTTIQF